MADISASSWNENDPDNDDASPDGFPEGMAPSGVNNGARAIMGATKRWYNWTIPKTTAGTSTAYTLTYGVAPGALVDGMTHLVLFNAANGAAPTLNVNSLGAKPLYCYDGTGWSAVPAGAITANMIIPVSYDSSAGSYRLLRNFTPSATTYLTGSNVNLSTTAGSPTTIVGTGSLPPGNYLIIAKLCFNNGSSGNATCTAIISDGTNAVAGGEHFNNGTTVQGTITIPAYVSHTVATTYSLLAVSTASSCSAVRIPQGTLIVPSAADKMTSITAVRLA